MTKQNILIAIMLIIAAISLYMAAHPPEQPAPPPQILTYEQRARRAEEARRDRIREAAELEAESREGGDPRTLEW